MRLAFVLDDFPALSETFILNQITGMIDRDLPPDIYALNRCSPDHAHEDVIKYGLLDQVAYSTRLPQNKVVRVLGGMGQFLKLFPKSPRAAIAAANPMHPHKIGMTLRSLYEMAPFFTSKKYDLIHCHFGHVGASLARMRKLGLMAGKLVVTFYGFDISQRPKTEPPEFYDDLFEQASVVLVLSHVMKAQVVKLGCSEDKVHVHHLGVDSRKFTFKPRIKKGNQTIQLLSIARLAEKKGLKYSIAALGQIIKQRQDFVYNIVGEGPLREPLQKQIHELGLQDHVHLLGWKKQNQVRAFLDESHILIAPSITAQAGDQEGTPTAIAEALMMGLPVLSTLHSGIPEMVQQDESGYLVPERDADALAKYMLILMDQPQRWAAMGQAGSHYARQEFDVNLLNDQLVRIYQEVCS